ncbi:MAG: anthranilate synthase component II [Kurthia gibsonii]|uniref:Aminodeoxychorismate/anthranilate synthase component II n=1 Tax=Kurthia gibsonii TaxID=33946 RepID=A0ABU9LJP6_9BACL|nr:MULTISPECIES: aminodeoxychorismate/anthranilate synthase component II [Kurthia]MEB6112216.1 aminodeoxychorismate/anthranilate synthase component II [Kurthia gibsonii]RXH51854.1 aminodeoxychorismate/anthranilate synthase component II [Kurthia gibsonii]WIL40109.1 aminodeoxychorismate/anthranilate synthase component II [Kurthia sp. YJT4]HZG10881.1 aminodeoxychorismate/anthranilate synthase component II [Kurthia gibsonii]
MILLIDNYDSFTYNLYQQIASLGTEVEVVRNDAITIEGIRALQPQAIVLSPGPGTPDEAGICLEVVTQLQKEFPILGICLGHQTIVQAFGGEIIQAKEIMHGRMSPLMHKKEGLLINCSFETEVMRYHSLVANGENFPHILLHVDAVTEDGEIMACHHRSLPIYGLQFHPESYHTDEGNQMIQAFLNTITQTV